MGNHKGEWCIYNDKIFCQEGYCGNCNLTKRSNMKFTGICKSKELLKEITLGWYSIGGEWELDETDSEMINKN